MINTVSQERVSQNALIHGIMDENNTLMLEILNYIIYSSTQNQIVFVSQSTIAARFKVTVRWVNHILSEWKARGVLRFEQRGFNQSCIYFFNPLLVQEKERLKWKLPCLRQIFFISSLWIAAFRGEFLLSNIRNIPLWKMTTLQQNNYAFGEPRPAKKESITYLFINNPTITIEKQELCLKESVMSQQTIINIISQSYNLSIEQQEQLSRYSFEALEYARKELYRQQKQNSLSNSQSATSWFSAVASSFEKKGSNPKTGRQMSFAQKKVIAPMFNSSHSPAVEVPNLSHMEQVEYLVKEILKFSKTFDPDKVYSPDPSMNEYLKKIAMNSIASMQREVDQLLKSFDDPNHVCQSACVEKSLFLRAPKKQDDQQSSMSSIDEDYESHLDEISKDKSDPESYKLMVRRYDYLRTKR